MDISINECNFRWRRKGNQKQTKDEEETLKVKSFYDKT